MNELTLGAATRAVVGRLEHVHVGVANLERSIAFYRRILGFELRWEGTGPSGRCAHVGSDRFYIAMTENPNLTASAPSGAASVYHFGFTTDALDAFRGRLEREQIAYSDSGPRAEGPAVYFTDPDGHEMEVVEYRPGYVYA